MVVVGTAISDNQTTAAPSGVVRGFDARTGALRWAFDPVRRGFEAAPHHARTEAGFFLGTANVWAPMSYDAERDLLFIPTGNSSPDYWGGHRRGLDEYASSVLALRGETGQLIWHFQTVHHDVWDYDVPAQPTLTELVRDGARVPAVLQTTKMGHLFVLHRETGVPLFPVEERPVPQGGVSGETLAATQPFPTKPPPLVRQRIGPDDAWGLTPFDRAWCRRRIEELRHDGPFAPPSLEGTLMYPGERWRLQLGRDRGGPRTPGRRRQRHGPLLARHPVPDRGDGGSATGRAGDRDLSPARGRHSACAARHSHLRWVSPATSHHGGRSWRWTWPGERSSGGAPFGTTRDMTPLPLAFELGLPNLGGPLITAAGLVFIGASFDNYLRAYDLETGAELWKGRLPAGGQATPMTYPSEGRQLVVIAAGGIERAGTQGGDHIVAFALP